METMGDVIATLDEQEKECIRILAAGKRGSALSAALQEKGISAEKLKNLVDNKLSLGELNLLMEMHEMWF